MNYGAYLSCLYCSLRTALWKYCRHDVGIAAWRQAIGSLQVSLQGSSTVKNSLLKFLGLDPCTPWVRAKLPRYKADMYHCRKVSYSCWPKNQANLEKSFEQKDWICRLPLVWGFWGVSTGRRPPGAEEGRTPFQGQCWKLLRSSRERRSWCLHISRRSGSGSCLSFPSRCRQ